METIDAPNIEPGKGRLVYDKERRTIVAAGSPDKARIQELEQRLKERTTERDYHMRVADQLAARVRELEASALCTDDRA